MRGSLGFFFFLFVFGISRAVCARKRVKYQMTGKDVGFRVKLDGYHELLRLWGKHEQKGGAVKDSTFITGKR